MTDSNISGSSSRDGRSTHPDPETELIRRVDAFGAAAMGFNSSVEPEASRQKQRYESARAALLKYVADRTLTAKEARFLLSPEPDIAFASSAERDLYNRALNEKLRRWSSPPVTTEEEAK